MEQVEVFVVFTDRLERAGINYMTTGSVVSMLYGIPRFAHDLDLVIDLPSHQINSIVEAFPLTDFYHSARSASREPLSQLRRYRSLCRTLPGA